MKRCVVPLIRVIPTGLIQRPDGIHVQVSLSVMPRPVADDAEGFDLASLPDKIGGYISQVRIQVDVPGQPAGNQIKPSFVTKPSADAAKIWKEAFSPAETADVFDELWLALQSDQGTPSSPTAEFKAGSGNRGYANDYVLSSPVSDHQDFLEVMRGAEALRGIGTLAQEPDGSTLDTLAASSALTKTLRDEFLSIYDSDTPASSFPAPEPTQKKGFAAWIGSFFEPAAPAPLAREIYGSIGHGTRLHSDHMSEAPVRGIQPAWRDRLASQFAAQQVRHRDAARFYGQIYKPGIKAAPIPKLVTRTDPTVRDGLMRLIQRQEFWADPADIPASPLAVEIEDTQNDLGKVVKTVLDGIASFHLATRRDVDTVQVEDDRQETARHKFSALSARPAFARAAGLLFDAEIPLNKLNLNGARFFRLSGALSGIKSIWTACEIDLSDGYVGPASIFAYTGQTDPAAVGQGTVQGLCNLAVEITSKAGGTEPRYHLAQIDASLGLEGWENAVRSRVDQKLQGARPEEVGRKLPELRSGGLSVIDTAAADEALRELAAVQDGRDTLYGEDLMVGLRLDVGIARAGGQLPASCWRSLVERELRISEPSSSFQRDDGWVRPIARMAKTEQGRADEIIVNETMCMWSGDSVAVPARGEEPPAAPDSDFPAIPSAPRTDAREAVTWIHRGMDLGIPFEVKQPERLPGRSKGLPALRFGRSYAIGARIAYLDGSSISLERASALYARGIGIAVDKSTKKPFVFRRWEEVQSPHLLLDPDDPLAHAPVDDGSQISRMVIRAGRTPPRRHLVAPRVSFETAERHGVFDEDEDDTPRGGFENFVLDDHGEFLAPRSHDHSPDDGGKKPKARDQVLKRGNSRPTKPYYPDPLAEFCCLAFMRNGRTPAGFGKGSTLDPRALVIPFNPSTSWPTGAVPIAIELRRLPAIGEARGRMNWDGSTHRPTVIVELAEGETIDLWAWSIPTATAALRQHALIPSLVSMTSAMATMATPSSALQAGIAALQPFRTDTDPLLAMHARPASVQQSDFEKLFARSPIPGLSTTMVMTLQHACERPVLPPEWGSSDCNGSTTAFALIRPADKGKTPAEAWMARLDADKSECGRLSFESDPGAQVAYLAGRALVEHASSASVRVELSWTEFESTALTHRTANGLWDYRPRDQGWKPFASTIDIPVGAGGVLTTVDLVMAESGQYRDLAFDFGDTRARRVSARLVATSRYAASYPKEKQDQSTSASTMLVHHYWVKATQRPPAPGLLETETRPAFRYATRQLPDGFEVERTSICRIWLSDWFASGEGELLAAACVPQEAADPSERDAATRKPVGILDDKPYSAFVTRRGHDPVFRSGRLNNWLVPEDMNAGGHWAKADMPYLVPPSPAGETIDDASASNAREEKVGVALAPYVPRFDPRSGRWHCDLVVDPGQSYAPFVRFALVRWQPHAIRDQGVSLPVTAWHRILPRRTARLTLIDPRRVRVTVRGQGYNQTATPSPSDGIERTQRPHLRVTLQEYDDGWLTSYNPETRQEFVLEREADDFEGEASWDVMIDLPASHHEVHFAVYLEEYSRFEGDEGDLGTTSTEWEQIYQCKIDFRSGHDLG